MIIQDNTVMKSSIFTANVKAKINFYYIIIP